MPGVTLPIFTPSDDPGPSFPGLPAKVGLDPSYRLERALSDAAADGTIRAPVTVELEQGVRLAAARAEGDEELERAWTEWSAGVGGWFQLLCSDAP